MSYQEIAKDMIDKLPADKMIYVINILENLGEMYGISIYPNYEPNKETVEAIEEVDKMTIWQKSQHYAIIYQLPGISYGDAFFSSLYK